MVLQETKPLTFLFLWTVAAMLIVYSVYLPGNPETNKVYPMNCRNISCAVENSSYYLIQTPSCTIPDFDPSLPSMAKFKVKKPKELVCFKKPPLTEEVGLSLIFHKERIPQYASSSDSSLNCSYQGITRTEQKPEKYKSNCDNRWTLEKKLPIEERETTIKEDGILVTCEDQKTKKMVYKSVHFFIQPRRVEEKRKKFKVEFGDRRNHREMLNVIIMGTDSVSRGNLHRNMPETFDYLTNELNAIDFKGYNKVADNTDPNLMAVLMGLTWAELNAHECIHKKIKTIYDKCPLLWKDFAEKGYATAFGEDAPWMGVFHYRKAGFCREPTDFYNRPYFYASDKLTGNSAGNRGYAGNLCQAGRKSISVVHNYSLSIAEELKDIPYFGFYWTASITHSDLNAATKADKPSVEYLKRLKEGGYLENTILFFISDHGMRFGKFRTTYPGMLEERLPYLMMVFPDWFIEQYPKVMMNIWINTKRLTSPFDIHVTLHDVLNQAFADPSKSTPTLPRRGRSLFQEMPLNRTCEDAGIPEHYCTCEHTKAADPADPQLLTAAKDTLDEINNGLLQFPECVELNVSKVLSGRVGSANSKTMPKQKNTVATTYMVTFTTEPGGGVLEATIRYHEGNYELSGEVSRVNQYGNQSHCIPDQLYRKYCYCKDLLL